MVMIYGGMMVIIEMVMMTMVVVVKAGMVMGGQVMQKIVRHFQCAIAQHHHRIKNKQYGGSFFHWCKDNRKAAWAGSVFKENVLRFLESQDVEKFLTRVG
jgi:hypothetical protein